MKDGSYTKNLFGVLSLVCNSGNAEYGVMSEQIASFLIGSAMLAVGTMNQMDILRWMGFMFQSIAMCKMSLIVRAWSMDHDYYDPQVGRAYESRRKALRARMHAKDAGTRSILRIPFSVPARKIPLSGHIDFLFYTTLIVLVMVWYWCSGVQAFILS